MMAPLIFTLAPERGRGRGEGALEVVPYAPCPLPYALPFGERAG